jgi:hypothetical protein
LEGCARIAASPAEGANLTSNVCDKVEGSGVSGEPPAPSTILFRQREFHDRIRFSQCVAIATCRADPVSPRYRTRAGG